VSPRAEQIVNLKAVALSAIVTRCSRAPRTFLTASFFTVDARARTAGRASAPAPRLSNRNAQRRNGQSVLRRTTSGAAGNGLGTSIKYLQRTTSGAAGNGLSRWTSEMATRELYHPTACCSAPTGGVEPFLCQMKKNKLVQSPRLTPAFSFIPQRALAHTGPALLILRNGDLQQPQKLVKTAKKQGGFPGT
jgi:hypothetical protein